MLQEIKSIHVCPNTHTWLQVGRAFTPLFHQVQPWPPQDHPIPAFVKQQFISVTFVSVLILHSLTFVPWQDSNHLYIHQNISQSHSTKLYWYPCRHLCISYWSVGNIGHFIQCSMTGSAEWASGSCWHFRTWKCISQINSAVFLPFCQMHLSQFLSHIWKWVSGVGGLLQRLPSQRSSRPPRQRRRAAVARAAAAQGQDSSWSGGSRDGAGGLAVGHQHPHRRPRPRPLHPLQLWGRPDCLELQGEQQWWEGEEGGSRRRGEEAGACHHHWPLPAQARLSAACTWVKRAHLGQREKPDLPRWVSYSLSASSH